MAADNNELIGKMYFKQEELIDSFNEFKEHYYQTQIKQTAILTKQEENLAAHMKRSDLLEKQVELLAQEFKPIRSHVDMLKGTAKFIALLGVIATITKAVMTFIH